MNLPFSSIIINLVISCRASPTAKYFGTVFSASDGSAALLYGLSKSATAQNIRFKAWNKKSARTTQQKYF
jgi:hypothetical protein